MQIVLQQKNQIRIKISLLIQNRYLYDKRKVSPIIEVNSEILGLGDGVAVTIKWLRYFGRIFSAQ